MGKTIGIKRVLRPNPDYPIRQILVDTSIVIRYENPFGFVKADVNSRTVQQVHRLKSHYQLHATMLTAAEYFKYVQVGYYNIFIQTNSGHFRKYSIANFKSLKKNSAHFQRGWQLRLSAFRKTFQRHFPPAPQEAVNYNPAVFDAFDGSKADFGDFMLYRQAESLTDCAILTADKDFALFEGNAIVIRV